MGHVGERAGDPFLLPRPRVGRCPRRKPRIQPVGTRNDLFELLACLDG
jgi:hypothetical protein